MQAIQVGSFTALNGKLAHKVEAAVAAVSLQETEGPAAVTVAADSEAERASICPKRSPDAVAARFRRQACCHSPPKWLPSRRFLALPSSKSYKLSQEQSTFTGDSCPVPSIAHTLQPLTDELRCDKKWSERLELLVTMEAAFAAAKQTLLFATHLAHPTAGAVLSLVLDASPTQEGLAAPGILL